MSTILEHPAAQALLADADVSPADVRGCRHRLHAFLARYLPCFYRAEQRQLAEVVVQGKLSNLQRKTSEPIAYLANRPRKPVQHFVGAGAWDDEAVQTELRRHVADAWGDDEAVLVLDPSGFPKKGDSSCGVQRQWCGRLGKVDNCQVGVFLAYVTAQGVALVDRQLYLPREWARSRKRRRATHVPKGIRFRESWRIGLDLIERTQADLPLGWITGDDEFGRVTALRAQLRRRQLRYVLDVPCDTLVRDINEAVLPGKRRPPWRRVDDWAKAQPASRWHKVQRGDGCQGSQGGACRRGVGSEQRGAWPLRAAGAVGGGACRRWRAADLVHAVQRLRAGVAGACGVGAGPASRGGGGVGVGQGGGGSGPLRGTQLGGLAPPHDAVVVGVVVFGVGEGAAGEKKSRR